MSAEKYTGHAWRLWPHEQCHECGGDVFVYAAPDLLVCDGDFYHCDDGHSGTISADEDGAGLGYLHVHDDDTAIVHEHLIGAVVLR